MKRTPRLLFSSHHCKPSSSLKGISSLEIDNNIWIAHCAKDFYPLWEKKLSFKKTKSPSSLGHNFYLINFLEKPSPETLSQSIFSRYWLPVDYMWPTKISEKGFLEKCAQGLLKKFSASEFQNIIVFSIDRKKQHLASNLRGRLLQIFKYDTRTQVKDWTKTPNLQNGQNKVLIVTFSEKCVWAGITSLNVAGSVYGGGRHYVSVASESIASRAASKFVESMDYLKLKDKPLDKAQKWLELGAAPGGITYELAKNNKEVWAVDKANLDKEILKNPLVHFHQMDAREFKANVIFDALFCDLNGPSQLSADICSEQAKSLKKDGILIHTFKIHSIEEFQKDFEIVVKTFEKKNCVYLEGRHLYNNKQEITLFFMKN